MHRTNIQDYVLYTTQVLSSYPIIKMGIDHLKQLTQRYAFYFYSYLPSIRNLSVSYYSKKVTNTTTILYCKQHSYPNKNGCRML